LILWLCAIESVPGKPLKLVQTGNAVFSIDVASVIFISHAGADVVVAAEVARLLTSAGIEVRLDRIEVGPGASVVQFMESALGVSDYCMLLWSEAARKSPWVTEEWQNAFYRSISECRAFLVVARLENTEVPHLLRSRVWVDLFPNIEPGINVLITRWRTDKTVGITSGFPVAQALCPLDEAEGENVYISSELYAFTFPARVRLEQPVGILIDRIIRTAGLKRRIHDRNRIGLQLDYRLMLGDRELDRSTSLASAGVSRDAILNLVVQARVVAATTPRVGKERPLKFFCGDQVILATTAHISDREFLHKLGSETRL
jgi:hypothetical protein